MQLGVVLTAAAVVRNHNQLQCCSILYSCEHHHHDCKTFAPFHLQKIAPQHLQGLWGWHRDAAEPLTRIHLDITQVLPALLSLENCM